MTQEQRMTLDAIAEDIVIAAGATRRADDMAQGELRLYLDPELLGHISIAQQHIWMAQEMLAHMEHGQEATNG
jgi:hypothetical protein